MPAPCTPTTDLFMYRVNKLFLHLKKKWFVQLFVGVSLIVMPIFIKIRHFEKDISALIPISIIEKWLRFIPVYLKSIIFITT